MAASSQEPSGENHCSVYVPKRYVVTALACSCIHWCYALRINLSVAIVAMVKSAVNNTASSEECFAAENVTAKPDADGEFDWSPNLQGIVLSSLFYGYIFMSLAGGVLAERFGVRIVFGLAMSCMSVLSLFTALAARGSVYLLIVIRVLQGACSSCMFSSLPVVMERWAPVSERNRLMLIVISGSYMGAIVSQLLSGVLSDSAFLGGWPSVFYVMGGCGLISGLLWLVLVRDGPEEHPSISKTELDFIRGSTAQTKKKYRIPWRSIFTSVPVWAAMVGVTCIFWAVYAVLALFPTYLKQILHVQILENGLLSSIPYLAGWVGALLAGIISDFLIKSGKMSTTAVQKATFAFGGLSLAAFTIAIGHTGCDVTLAIVYLTLGVGLGSFLYPVYMGNSLEIAPTYAGTIYGLINTVSHISGTVGPSVAQHIVGNEPSQSRWRIFFYLTGGICTFGSLVFLVFGSAELQPWAETTEEEKVSDKKTNGVTNGGFTQREDKDQNAVFCVIERDSLTTKL